MVDQGGVALTSCTVAVLLFTTLVKHMSHYQSHERILHVPLPLLPEHVSSE